MSYRPHGRYLIIILEIPHTRNRFLTLTLAPSGVDRWFVRNNIRNGVENCRSTYIVT